MACFPQRSGIVSWLALRVKHFFTVTAKNFVIDFRPLCFRIPPVMQNTIQKSAKGIRVQKQAATGSRPCSRLWAAQRLFRKIRAAWPPPLPPEQAKKFHDEFTNPMVFTALSICVFVVLLDYTFQGLDALAVIAQ